MLAVLLRTGVLLASWWLGVEPQSAPAKAAPVHDSPVAVAVQSVSGARMLMDVERLSRPDLNGRMTGSADDLQSGLLVADRLRGLGLTPGGAEPLPQRPAGESWAITMPVNAGHLRDEAKLALVADDTILPAHLGTDYLPVLNSPSTAARAPVVFVGYGISDPDRGLDEYETVDVRDKVVLFLRGKPQGYTGPVSQADKVRHAHEHGAIAYLTATGPTLSPYEARRGVTGAPAGSYVAPNDEPGGRALLPGCWISTDLADKIVDAGGRSLREVQRRLNADHQPQAFLTPVTARLAWDSTAETGTLFDVLGLLPPARGRDEPAAGFVVIGAHRDHLGRHGDLFFPGADDNASGTAVLLEVARAMAQSGVRPKRPVLFASFSGEEQGLLGSRLYVARAAASIKKTVAMINVDHAGVGNGRLTVGAAGIDKAIMAKAARIAGLVDRLDVYGFFPGGDHVPFTEAGVPTVTIVSSGVHPDFHRPTDTAEKIKPDVLEAVARFVLALTWVLAEAP